MKRYETYKETGIGQIGEIPACWEITRIGNLFDEISERYDAQCDVDAPLLSVSEYYGVAKRSEKIAEDSILVRTETLDGYKKCQKNDIVSNIMLTWKGALGCSPLDGIVSPAYCVYRPRKNIDSRYFHYLFRTKAYTDLFHVHSTGLIDSRLRLYTPKFFSLYAILPTKEEQTQIASYLDQICDKIDALILEAKASIEEYKAWKASIIYEVVTKGLDPNVEMKDSGVDWIAEVPTDWKILSAKHVVYINHGSDPQSEGDIPVYGSGANSFRTCGEFKEGPTVLIGRKGATLHIPHYIEGKYWNVDTAFDVKPLNADLLLKFYYYLATCFDYKYYMSQTTLPSMTQTSYNSMKIPVPSQKEQGEIIEFLDRKTGDIDLLIGEKEALIADLESYKKSLIFEVVTGKRKVV